MALADADPVTETIGWLSAHPAVTAALGGEGRVSAMNLPPYPRLVVTDPPGGDGRDLRWLTVTTVQLEAIGDLDGSPGKAVLRRVLWVALEAAAELPTVPAAPGRTVVTGVTPVNAGGWVPLPSGQPRYVALLNIAAHPPQP